jgi:ribosomal-protein-alanine N-acetyltransferase
VTEPRFDFGPFPVLETPRLILRELTEADADAVFAIRACEAVVRYNGGVPYTRVDQAAALIRSIGDAYRERRAVRWGITLRGGDAVIGLVGFNYWVQTDYRASVGYDLAHAYWGRGIMPEALRAVIAFGFTEMGLNRVEADAAVDNANSIRVLQKLGFLSEGVQREQYYERGEFFDLALFSLLRRQYES